MPTPFRRPRSARWLVPAFAGLSLIACVEDDPSPEGDPELQSLLDDGDLSDVVAPLRATSSALSIDASRPPRGDSDGGAMGDSDGGRGDSDGGAPQGPDAGSNDGGFPSPDGGCSPFDPFCSPDSPLGEWDLDDCNSERSDLRPSRGRGFTAFRSVRSSCVPGVEGQGIALPNRTDLVYVPDQPAFTFQRGVTVSAWVNPTSVSGARTIMRKREGRTSSFALMLVDGRFTFVVARSGKAPVAVRARAPRGRFVHVAGTYDGAELRLYLDGSVAATVAAPGAIDEGEGPLLVGNDGDRRRLEGTFDRIFFDNRAATADEIRAQTCLMQAPTLAIQPAAGPPVAAGTPVTYEVALTNRNAASCGPAFVSASVERIDNSLSIDPPFLGATLNSGETTRLPFTVTSADDLEPGTFRFSLSARGQRFEPFNSADATYTVTASGCSVRTRKELMITDLGVVDDPARTTNAGPWTFAHLMQQLAPRPEQAADLAASLFESFTKPQTVNGFTIDARPGMKPLVLDAWPRGADGKLDLARAPLQLLAIVNRMDLRNLADGNAGEGRLVFGVNDRSGFPLEFTMIFEYKLPARTEADVLAWAQAWHALGELPFPSEAYNAALQALTDRFVSRGAMPGRPNGSALHALRTNEISLGGIWQLREFGLSSSGQLVPVPVKLTPDQSFDNSERLASWVQANQDAITNERHDVPLSLDDGAPFAAAAVFNELGGWSVPGASSDLQHKFSLNTCNGCHSLAETNTFFVHVGNRFPGSEAPLSAFLRGTVVFDRQTGQPRALNDLLRRRRDLHPMVCPDEPLPPLPTPPSPPMTGDAGVPFPVGPGVMKGGSPISEPATTVGKGIDRVH